MLDDLIVGVGSASLSSTIEASKRNLDYLVIDKGRVVNSIKIPSNRMYLSSC
jgi:thioredoxin reductase